MIFSLSDWILVQRAFCPSTEIPKLLVFNWHKVNSCERRSWKFFFSFEDLHAIEIAHTNVKLPLNCNMASSQAAVSKFMTLVTLAVVFFCQVAFVFADLAPNEDEEDVKPPTDLKKPDESVTTLEPPKGSNLGFIHAFIASFSVIIVSEIGDKTFFIAAIMSMVSKLLLLFVASTRCLF